MHDYIRLIRRSCRHYVALLGMAYVLMHGYALYMSTQHAFHDMPPMCELCAAVKSYESSSVNTVIAVFTVLQPDYIHIAQFIHFDQIVIALFQARAPPY